jgi:heptosyltransferase-2
LDKLPCQLPKAAIVMDRKIERILIIRFGSLGDVVLTTPVIDALKAAFPAAEISFLTKVRYRDLLKADPRIARLVEFDSCGRHRGIGGLMKLISELRSGDFDLLVDLHSNLRSFVVRRLVRSRIKIRYDKRRWSRFLMVHCKFFKTKPVHTVDSYLAALRPLGLTTRDRTPMVFPPEDDLRFTENFLLERNVKMGDIVIGVHPGAKWEPKRWEPEKFAQVCRALTDRLKAKIVMFGEAGEEETVRQVASNLPEPSIIRAVGLSLGQLMAAIRRCDCLISNDSGPMHLASALRVPVVAIFGPTHPKLGFAPLGPEAVVFCADQECSPCSLHGEKRCRKRSRLCMDAVDPAEVAKAAERLIAEKSSLRGISD